MSAQVGGQAIGPIFAGLMFDGTGSYQAPFLVLALVATLAGLMVIFATPPNLKAGAPVSAV